MSPESIFLGLLLTRGPHLAALLSAFGCVVFVTFPRGPAPRGLFQTSLGLGIVMGLLWLVVQSADFADGAGPAAVLNAIPVVAFQTRFGQWLLIRLALMMIAWACFRTRRPVAALIILVPAIAAESRFSHAGAALGRDWVETLAPAMATLHLLAAGAWLGGLLPLRHLLAWAPERAIPVVRRFSVLGIAAVGTIAVTAAWQAALEVGGLAGWVGTDYGRLCLLKLAVFAMLIGLAAINRQRLSPALASAKADRAIRLLRASITAEIALGLMAIAAGTGLALLPPAVHEQPLWPFAIQPSLLGLTEPELRGEALTGLGLALVAALLTLRALIRRRWRWPIGATACLALGLALPHLDLFVVPAYPTSFFQSPTGFSASSITEGAHLFERHCAACHGAAGRGDGPMAGGLAVPPADLTADHLWDHPDGELFWWLSHGIDGPDGGLSMPGFAAMLTPDERWNLIDFVHANGAGQAATPHPVEAPSVSGQCPDHSTRHPGGGLLRIALDDDPAPGPYDESEAPTLILRRAAITGPNRLCVAIDRDAWTAYAILAGAPSDDAGQGRQLLVDPDGFIRAHWRPGDRPDWREAGVLRTLAIRLGKEALVAAMPSGHVHHH